MRRIIPVLLMTAWASGCTMACPRVFHPGSQDYQRYRATLHDPYPDNDAGPELTGVRPPSFDKPLPENVRSRWLRDSWWAR